MKREPCENEFLKVRTCVCDAAGPTGFLITEPASQRDREINKKEICQ